MASTMKWATVSHRCVALLGRSIGLRRSCRRFLQTCLVTLGVFMIVGSVAQAATLHGGDIVVVDAGAGKLFLVDPHSGVRTVISDFRDPSQGPVDQSFLSGVAIGRGQILVTAATTGIYAVDPGTGKRTLLSDFTKGTFQGDVFGSAVDSAGRIVVNWAQPQFGGAPRSMVRVDSSTGARLVITDLTNPAQGDAFNCCVAYFNDVALEPSGAMVASLTWFPPVGPSRDVGDVYTVDPATGQRSPLSDFSNAAQGITDVVPATGMAVETSGKILLNARASGVAPSPRNLLLQVDPKTGNRAVLSDFDNAAQGPLGWRLSGIAVENSGAGGVIVGAGNPADKSAQPTLLFRVNPQTGKRTLLSDSTDPKQGPALTWIYEIAIVPDNADNAGFHIAPPKSSFASPFVATQ